MGCIRSGGDSFLVHISILCSREAINIDKDKLSGMLGGNGYTRGGMALLFARTMKWEGSCFPNSR